MMPRGRRGLRLASILLLAVGVPAGVAAQKTDTLTLINGDRITGEIKGVSRGKLTYDTDDAGTLSIEWVKVVRLTSVRSYDISDRVGRHYFGPLRRSTGDGLLAIGADSVVTLRIRDAVELTEVGGRVMQRVSGSADIGFTYTKANKATTLDFNGDLKYRGPKFGASVSLDTYEQAQEDVDPISRASGSLTASRFLKRQLSVESMFTVERNDELDLARRISGGGGMGRTLRESNHDVVLVVLGVVVTQERFTADTSADDVSTNLEASANLKGEYFRFDKPKLDFLAEVGVFKSFTTAGRLRGNASFEAKYVGVRDFSVGLRVTDTFDTKPPTEGASKNDYTVSFTFGWSYRR